MNRFLVIIVIFAFVFFAKSTFSASLYPGSIINISEVTVSGNVSSQYIRVDATLGPVEVTLPDATASQGKIFYAIKTDASLNSVTIKAQDGQDISGMSSYTFTQRYSSIVVGSNGIGWEIF